MSYIQEEWKPVVGWEGLYEVSASGLVMSNQSRWLRSRLLVAFEKRNYLYVGLSRNGRTRHLLIHRIVMAAFVGPCPLGKEVNHQDGVTTNNHVSNLEYVTKQENYGHARINGLYTVGREHPLAKLTDADVREIRSLRGKVSGVELAANYGVAATLISRIQRGEAWKHVSKAEQERPIE